MVAVTPSSPPPAKPVPSRTVIVGGGLAGLSAAVGLATAGQPAILLESRPRLGGRAGSFRDSGTDEWIDHCQHVGMGCCTSLLWLIQTVGLQEYFRRDTTLHFVSPPHPDQPPTIHPLRASCLPAPFHLLPGLSRLNYLDRRSRREIRRGLLALARTTDHNLDQPFDRWLGHHGQSPESISNFWEVILVSALSESLDRISVAHARHVFVTGFLAHRRGWEPVIPRAPLEQIYGQRLSLWLAERGIEVRTGSGVDRVEIHDDKVTGVQLRDGTLVTTDQVILSVPHHRVANLLPESLARHRQIAALEQLDTAPIAAVHLWLDRPLTDLPHAVLVGRLGQWLFRRESPTANGDYVQVVISAARHVTQRDRQDVIDEVTEELRGVWPKSAGFRVLRSRLVIEHRAVLSPRPGSESSRPGAITPWPGLFLAGDWTQTGWPSTMEGAVRSGLIAVESLLAVRGTPIQLQPPALPAGRLARFLLPIDSRTTPQPTAP
ncbi:MAG TPA: Carotene 7,8-desaturase [Planctomycetaceae bacterium]|nr:Carotene 7,8-desaturase [Planctomycetaceae bacterium]